jgi:hypothetical protein
MEGVSTEGWVASRIVHPHRFLATARKTRAGVCYEWDGHAYVMPGYDKFMAMVPEGIAKRIASDMRTIRGYDATAFLATRSPGSLTWHFNNAKIQIILRTYASPSEVLHGFDLGSASTSTAGSTSSRPGWTSSRPGWTSSRPGWTSRSCPAKTSRSTTPRSPTSRASRSRTRRSRATASRSRSSSGSKAPRSTTTKTTTPPRTTTCWRT